MPLQRRHRSGQVGVPRAGAGRRQGHPDCLQAVPHVFLVEEERTGRGGLLCAGANELGRGCRDLRMSYRYPLPIPLLSKRIEPKVIELPNENEREKEEKGGRGRGSARRERNEGKGGREREGNMIVTEEGIREEGKGKREEGESEEGGRKKRGRRRREGEKGRREKDIEGRVDEGKWGMTKREGGEGEGGREEAGK
eukprot:679326-Hanusia_phi.AAC.1